MIKWRGKDYRKWTDALEEQQAEIERLTAAMEQMQNLNTANSELIEQQEERIEKLEAALAVCDVPIKRQRERIAKLKAAICAFMDAEGSEPTTLLTDVLKEVSDE